MLPALDYVAWFVAFYLVVVTRDFSVAVFEAIFLSGVIILLTEGTGGGDVEVFRISILRPLYAILGGVSGFLLAAGLQTRTLIPVHAFSNTRVHFAGPILLAGIALATYAFEQALGQDQLQGEDNPLSDGGELAIWIVTIVLFGLALIGVLIFSWLDWGTFLALRYQDAASRMELVPVQPLSRLAVEVFLFSVGIFAPFAAWIVLPRAPTLWPQWGAGLLSIVLSTGMFVAMYFALRERHAIDRVHFDAQHSHMTWLSFIVILGGTFLLTAITWLIVAEFVTTEFEATMTIVGLSAFVIVVSIVVSCLPVREWVRL